MVAVPLLAVRCWFGGVPGAGGVQCGMVYVMGVVGSMQGLNVYCSIEWVCCITDRVDWDGEASLGVHLKVANRLILEQSVEGVGVREGNDEQGFEGGLALV